MGSGRSALRMLAVAVTVATVAAACGNRGFDPDPEVVAQGHTWHHADCLLGDIVLDGLPPRPGASGDEIMPGFRGELTDTDVDAILTYVKTWWTGEQRRSRAEVTAAECTDQD